MSKYILIFMGVSLFMLATNSNTPRGIRNNNPGNIRENDRVDYDWQGEAIIDNDEEFEVFESPEYGIRALARILKNYESLHGLNTVRGIINRWAPPSENNTESYVNHVAQVLGVGIDQPISVVDNLVPLTEAIILHENGQNPYSMETIVEGVMLA